MAAKIWYKHIKVGDTVLVKLDKSHLWYWCYKDTTMELTVTDVHEGRGIFGDHYTPDGDPSKHLCLILWNEPKSGHYGTIIRKVKKEF